MKNYLHSLKNVTVAYASKRPLDFENTNYYLARWPSIIITPFFLKLKIGANTVTWLSFLVGMLAIGCLATPNLEAQVIAFGLLYIAFLLDNVDGNIARTHRLTNHYGKFIDGSLGLTYGSLKLLAIGIGLGHGEHVKILSLSPTLHVAIGGAGTAAVLLQSYISLRFKSAKLSLNQQRAYEKKADKDIAKEYQDSVSGVSKCLGLSIYTRVESMLFRAWSTIYRVFSEMEWPILLPAIFFWLDIYLIIYCCVKLINLFVTYISVLKNARTDLSYFRPH
jgi:phosphatidylglycerophosphate synthase